MELQRAALWSAVFLLMLSVAAGTVVTAEACPGDPPAKVWVSQ